MTIDTLRADHLGIYGNPDVSTPNIDALGSEGIVFTRAFAQVPLTLPSHTTLFTGIYPMAHGVRDLSTSGVPQGIPTLAEIFKSRGYSTAAFVSAFVLNSTWGLNRGFDLYDDGPTTPDGTESGKGRLEQPATQTIESALQWLKTHHSTKFFLWIHLYDPHSPYNAPEPFKSAFAGRPYDGEVAYVDAQLGRLVTLLKELNLFSATAVVVAGDHGEALGEHQEREHGFFVYNSTLRVPLILKLPGAKPSSARVDTVAGLVDVGPTLLRACGFPSSIFPSFQGRDLLSRDVRDTNDAHFAYSESLYPASSFGWHSLHSLQNERYHYVEAGHSELYDLTEDPGELRNIIDQKPAVAAAMKAKIQTLQSRYQRGKRTLSPTTSDIERSRKLQALGYVGSVSPSAHTGASDDSPDPKDKIEVYNQVLKATELTEEDNFQQAESVFQELTAKYPEMFLLPYLRAENLFAAGEAKQAIAHYRRALELNPHFDMAAMGLGHAAYRSGDDAEAIAAYNLALKLNPHNFLVRLALAKAYVRLNRLSEAANEQWMVVRANPQRLQAQVEYARTLILQRKLPDALTVLRKATANPKASSDIYNLMGTVYVRLAMLPDAITAFKRAIELDPQFAPAYASLALVYYKMQDQNNFHFFFEKTCKMDAELCRTIDPSLR